MRILLALASVLALSALAPAATAAQCPPMCVYAFAEPSESGVTAGAGISEPDNCYDCGGVGAEAGVHRDGDGTTVHLLVCRGGFVHICPVDQAVTV